MKSSKYNITMRDIQVNEEGTRITFDNEVFIFKCNRKKKNGETYKYLQAKYQCTDCEKKHSMNFWNDPIKIQVKTCKLQPTDRNTSTNTDRSSRNTPNRQNFFCENPQNRNQNTRLSEQPNKQRNFGILPPIQEFEKLPLQPFQPSQVFGNPSKKRKRNMMHTRKKFEIISVVPDSGRLEGNEIRMLYFSVPLQNYMETQFLPVPNAVIEFGHRLAKLQSVVALPVRHVKDLNQESPEAQLADFFINVYTPAGERPGPVVVSFELNGMTCEKLNGYTYVGENKLSDNDTSIKVHDSEDQYEDYEAFDEPDPQFFPSDEYEKEYNMLYGDDSPMSPYDIFGRSVLHYLAAQNKHDKLRNLIEKEKHNPNVVDIMGYSPLDVAKYFKNVEVCKYLETEVKKAMKKEKKMKKTDATDDNIPSTTDFEIIVHDSNLIKKKEPSQGMTKYVETGKPMMDDHKEMKKQLYQGGDVVLGGIEKEDEDVLYLSKKLDEYKKRIDQQDIEMDMKNRDYETTKSERDQALKNIERLEKHLYEEKVKITKLQGEKTVLEERNKIQGNLLEKSTSGFKIFLLMLLFLFLFVAATAGLIYFMVPKIVPSYPSFPGEPTFPTCESCPSCLLKFVESPFNIKELSKLREMTTEANLPPFGASWELLYRASDHGDTGERFHKYCDNHNGTLVVIKTEKGRIIGGYNPLMWNLPSNEEFGEGLHAYRDTPGSFVFGFDEDEGKFVRFDYSRSEGRGKRFLKWRTYGPMFGTEVIWIDGNKVIRTYELSSYRGYQLKEGYGVEFLKDEAGKIEFKYIDYEVYKKP